MERKRNRVQFTTLAKQNQWESPEKKVDGVHRLGARKMPGGGVSRPQQRNLAVYKVVVDMKNRPLSRRGRKKKELLEARGKLQ